MWEEVKADYKVISYRGDLSLEKWLNEMESEWYDAVNVLADNNKYIVVYRKYEIVVREEE